MVKASYLKRALGVSKLTPSRLVYEQTKEPFLIEELRLEFLLPSTGPYEVIIKERTEKRKGIDLAFYDMSAFTDRSWTLPSQELRHVVTRLAVHGFHHKVCSTSNFHMPVDSCVCKLCLHRCARYHILQCSALTVSITELATVDNSE